MIYDSLNHIDAYRGIHPGVWKGLELLRDTDFTKVEDGRYELDGENLFYFIQTYENNPANETPEAHKKYIDIQCVLTGKERMDVGALEDMTEEVEGRPDNDIWFYRGPMDSVTLSPGKFAVLWPGDAHAPGIAIGTTEQVRKCVVKVKVEY
ncbi:MAG: YhcH/YjgK/YiaL family protein [Ruminiclostridium sp.]|nr:YhcH/YjgK/YiaL family protein [Ruminiclostridium sp.]